MVHIRRIDEMAGRPKVMYRTEEYSGSEVRDAVEVISFEAGELDNTDIFDYCLNNYDLTPSGVEAVEKVRNDMPRYGSSSPAMKAAAKAVIDGIHRTTGRKIRYALWLAPKRTVRELYDGDDGNISAYRTSDIILSDLGPDGTLFGYEEMPDEI